MVWTSAKKYFNCFKLFYYILPYLIFHLHCHLVLRISGNTIICNIKTRQITKFSLAGLASRNIVHLQKIILRCCGFCLYISTGCLSCKGNEMISTASCSLLCVDNFVFNSEEYGITYYKRLPGPVTEWESQRPPSMAMKIKSPPFWFYRKRSEAEKCSDSRENRLHVKTLRIQKFSDSTFPL